MSRVEATVKAIIQETPTIKSLLLDYGQADFSFQAGQWVELSPDMGDEKLLGSYSITSSATQPSTIQLAVKQGHDHPVTCYLYDRLQVGDKVSLSKPQGRWVYDPEENGTIVLIGAGVGLTPLMSILRTICDSSSAKKVRLLYSVASQQETLFAEEIERLAANNQNVDLQLTYTQQPPKGWQGLQGRVDKSMLKTLSLEPTDIFFICGPNEFVDTVAEGLTELEIPAQQLRYEKWW